MISINDAEEILKKEYVKDNYLFLINNILLPDFIKDEHIVLFENHCFENVTYFGCSEKCESSVFEVLLKEDCQNKRVLITQEMFKILKKLRINNAIVSFVNEDKKNYRISLLTSKYQIEDDKIVKVLSNPRRYSYSLGYGTKTKTPFKYLISKGPVNDLNDLVSRFSVEIVNKQFYIEIATCFTKLVGGTRNNKKYKELLSLKNVSDKNKYSEFGVRLIGRSIFCWFLMQKRSSSGLPLIPESFFTNDKIKQTNHYYQDVLEPLFFEILNKSINTRKEEFSNSLCNKIPYLNGGLFAPSFDDLYKYKTGPSRNYENVSIPNEWFEEFFAVLNNYNFTVDENTSYDIELSIDPEMLGRIFENLLAEINPETGENAKKSTGSFYTPRDVVDYMVDKSLSNFLKNKTNISEARLNALISYSKDDDELAVFSKEEIESIINSLYQITVLDPACGSGAFPIGMLQKIVYILQELDPDCNLWFKKSLSNVSHLLRKEIESKFNKGSLNYIRKLSVIQNSIFGIDIQPIAVEISRLRCFLSLIIEEKVEDDFENRGINPLPNLDFKFIIANSLYKLDKNTVSIFENEDDIERLKCIREEYFNSPSERRNELKDEFKDVQQNMLLNNIDNYKSAGSAKYYQLSSWRPFSNVPTQWFDAEWMFGIADGFDIVIGNPPYIGTGSRGTSERMDTSEKDYYKKEYPHSAEYKINMYALFMEFAISQCKTGGVSTFIVPDSFLLGMYFSKIRQYILNQCDVKYIAILGSDVFSACVGYSVVYLFEKTNKKNDSQITFIDVRNNNGFVDDSIRYSYPKHYAEKQNRYKFRIFFDERIKQLIDKIEMGSESLGRHFTGRTGVRSKVGQKNIIAFEQKEKTYKRGIISGGQVLPYFVNYDGDWINIDPKLLNAGGWDEYVISNPKLLIRQTADTIIAAFDDTGLYHLNNVHSLAPNDCLFDLKYILALLNSRLLRWYYEILANEKGRPMPQTDIETLELLPIKSNKSIEDLIVTEVDKILMNGEKNSNEETLKTIDSLVYQIYDLKESEILIIEDYFKN